MNSLLVFLHNFCLLAGVFLMSLPAGTFPLAYIANYNLQKLPFLFAYIANAGITFVAHEMHFYENCTVTQKEVLILSIFQS